MHSSTNGSKTKSERRSIPSLIGGLLVLVFMFFVATFVVAAFIYTVQWWMRWLERVL